MLDSTTNYECYKGLYSSHNDKKYFEIAHSLNRLFGPEGIYKDLFLYSFADNHDVNRIASTLKNPAHLYPLHCLLFTMPGVPSIYYGSEWGIEGKKKPDTDAPLRPALTLPEIAEKAPHPELANAIKQLAQIRKENPALRHGAYKQLFVAHEQFAFARISQDEQVIVAVNSADSPVSLSIKVDAPNGKTFTDLLDFQKNFSVQNGQIQINSIPSYWAKILVLKR